MVGGYSAVSCDFGVSVRRGELTSFYSAILSPLFFFFSFMLSLVSLAHQGWHAEALHDSLQTTVPRAKRLLKNYRYFKI